jgi:cyclic pyranopterin phosphate synthase
MPDPTSSKQPRLAPLSDDDLAEIIEVAASVGVTRVRFTGGEPLLRPDLSTLVRRVASIRHIEDVSMTTNGVLLEDSARQLAEAGLDRINISLDTTDADEYGRIAGRDALPRVLRGIDAALAAGLHPVKVNAVIGLSPAWQKEVVDLVRLALERPVYVRFIERMPFGSNSQEGAADAKDVLDTIAAKWNLSPMPGPVGGGPAEYFNVNRGQGVIGTISPISAPYCAKCNRLRLTSRGCLHPCLFSDAALDLRPALQRPPAERTILLRRALQAAALSKPQAPCRHERMRRRQMVEVGG